MKSKMKRAIQAQDAKSASQKKTTRDVICGGVRWTEAMRVVRADHPEVTIILPGEKIQVYPGDDVRKMISAHVSVIRQALDAKVGEWKGYTAECRIKQVRRLLNHYFHFHEGCITESDFTLLLDDLLFIHKQGKTIILNKDC